ncbi:class I SAM-dependent methyltransferase [Actinokineospora guangxiensis]|uniref:Class I SAM-dependent methyltransferase n=1 Tax=Actinokineospora guangxiensis TaxID=1490288 RepID=A0ABW0EJA3_9PSEU
MDLIGHYSTADEGARLTRSAHGRLEFLRTRELLTRVLPDRSRVLDVGGGTGVHARWLAADGHAVHVVDAVPGHVAEAARLPGVTAAVADARALPAGDGAYDAVLLLGPLYHLLAAADRRAALTEALRVLRPGGVLAAAGVSRYCSLLQAGSLGRLDAAMEPSVAEVVATGRYDGHVGFMPTHWHTADELAAEVAAAGALDVAVFGVEGPAWPALDVVADHAPLLDAAVRAARVVERDPLLINASAHLLAVGTR